MCIIITCDAYKRPTDDVLINSFLANGDGAGLAWCEGGAVQISKGYFDMDDYLYAVDAVPKSSPLVLHMRIGTSGTVCEETTHPFPVCKSLDTLHALDVACPIAIAHNGVLPYKGSDALRMSDTMEYIRKVVTPLKHDRTVVREGGLARSKKARARLRDTSRGSRLALIDAGGHIARIGAGWSTVAPGIYASNRSFEWYTPRHGAASWYYDDMGDDPTSLDAWRDCYGFTDDADDGYYIASRYGGWYDDALDD